MWEGNKLFDGSRRRRHVLSSRHVMRTARACIFHIPDYGQSVGSSISRQVNHPTWSSLSRLDYCNSVVAGLPALTLAPLQRNSSCSWARASWPRLSHPAWTALAPNPEENRLQAMSTRPQRPDWSRARVFVWTTYGHVGRSFKGVTITLVKQRWLRH